MGILDKIKKDKKFKDYIANQDDSAVKDFVSTGCVPLNVQFSGRLDGGIPIGKVSMLAAPSSLGKCARGTEYIEIEVSEETYNKYFSNFSMDNSNTLLKIRLDINSLFSILDKDYGVEKDTLYSDIPQMYINTPFGSTKILGLVKKPLQEWISLYVEDIENPIQVSPNHIFLEGGIDGKPVFAKDADSIYTIYGSKKVLKKIEGLKKEPLYDIAIYNENAPEGYEEYYCTPNGVVHHNSFIGLKIAKNAQKKGMEVIYLDTEFAFDFEFAKNIGLDTDNLLVYQNNSLEEVQHFIMNTVEELTKEEKAKILVVLDSFNGLVTSKSHEDALEGKDVVEMGKAKKLNSFSKHLLGMGVTVFVVNQIYNTMNQYDPFAIPGGMGIYFASTSIVLGTSKAKDKDSSGDIQGAIISTLVKKSRLAKENSKLKYMIKYEGGVHPTAGLEDDLLEMGFVTKPSNGWYQRNFAELDLEGEDKKWRMSEIVENWKEFYQPILSNTKVKKAFEEKYSFAHTNISDEDV